MHKLFSLILNICKKEKKKKSLLSLIKVILDGDFRKKKKKKSIIMMFSWPQMIQNFNKYKSKFTTKNEIEKKLKNY